MSILAGISLRAVSPRPPRARRALSVLLLTLLASPACGTADPEKNATEPDEAAAATVDPLAVAAAAELEAERHREGLLLPFWPRTGAATDGFDLHEHPCGESLLTRVRAIPLDDPVIEPELVIEYDEDGMELRRWFIPIDRNVDGLDGEVLMVPLFRREGREPAQLRIRPDGGFIVAPPVEPAEPEFVPCPTLEAFTGSDYRVCFRFREGGRDRYLTMELPCT
jgi:hypothetical protein